MQIFEAYDLAIWRYGVVDKIERGARDFPGSTLVQFHPQWIGAFCPCGTLWIRAADWLIGWRVGPPINLNTWADGAATLEDSQYIDFWYFGTPDHTLNRAS